MAPLDYNGTFEYNRETYNGYSIGNIILDIRNDFIMVEVKYHQTHKNSAKVIKHGFQVKEGDVDIDALLEKIYKMHQ